MRPIESRTVKIPEGVTVNLEGRTVEVIGERGRLVRDFSHVPLLIQLEGDEIVVSALRARKKERALIGTICSHIRNMVKGVTEGFTYKLKIVYSHFPISVKVDGKRVIIENFTGERAPRIAKIVGDVEVVVEGDDILVRGNSIEDVSQTAANIEQATRIRRKDPRVFLDGIYIYKKLKGVVG